MSLDNFGKNIHYLKNGKSLSLSVDTTVHSRFKLDERHVFRSEALVADPFGVNFLSQKMEGRLGQAGAHAMKPEIAAGLAKNRLKIHFKYILDKF